MGARTTGRSSDLPALSQFSRFWVEGFWGKATETRSLAGTVWFTTWMKTWPDQPFEGRAGVGRIRLGRPDQGALLLLLLLLLLEPLTQHMLPEP